MADPNNENEILLWNRFKTGDAESFVAIFKIYYPRLFNYGIKMSADTNIAEDCIQDLFTELWKSGGKAEIISLNAYLFTAFKFKMMRAIKASIKNNHSLSEKDETSFEISHELFLIDKEYNAELKQKFANSLNELSPRQKEIIYLKFYQNLSYEEISNIMQINYQAARSLLYQDIRILIKISGLLLLMVSAVN